MTQLFILRNMAILQRATNWIQAQMGPAIEAGHPLVLEIRPESSKRSVQQNKRYWAILADIAEQVWMPSPAPLRSMRRFDAEVWHEYAKRRFLPLIDLPDGSTMATSTTTLNTAEFAEYCQKVEAWAAQDLRVVFTEPDPIGRPCPRS